MVVKFSPKRSTIACAAGPKLLVNKSITKFNPTNPTPTVNAEIKALLGFVPKIKPKTKIRLAIQRLIRDQQIFVINLT